MGKNITKDPTFKNFLIGIIVFVIIIGVGVFGIEKLIKNDSSNNKKPNEVKIANKDDLEKSKDQKIKTENEKNSEKDSDEENQISDLPVTGINRDFYILPILMISAYSVTFIIQKKIS